MKRKSSEIEKFTNEIKDDNVERLNNFRKNNGIVGDIIIMLVAVLIIIITFIFVKNTLVSGIANFAHSFSEASETKQEEAYHLYYDDAYNKAYEKAMKENAISNNVYISVNSIKEMSKYEVLTVIEDATVMETEEQKKLGIYSWTRCKGKGVFTVDLSQSEILVDHSNYYISIKIPHPKFTYVPLNDKIETLFYIDTRKVLFVFPKKDTKTGLNIYDQQKSAANEKIYNSIKNNNDYVKKADDFAKSSLSNLVKTLNPDIAEKLNIEISFND